MKLKNYISLLALVLIGSLNVTAQVGRAFIPRLPAGNIQVKGDVVLIGNTVINKAATAPIFSPSPPVNGVTYTGTVTNLATLTAEANIPNNAPGNNNAFSVEYIDIDSDNTTFSSSTANLNINNACKRIVFAGLYWSAIYPYDRSTNPGNKYEGSLRDPNFNQIKFMIPGGVYQDITADEIIFDGYNAANVPNSFKDAPYVCFKDVTGLVSALPNADGDYTVANVRAARQQRNGGGAGGWTLVVVYESPTLPSKYISIFDGYVGVNPDSGPGQLLQVDFNVNGFRTLPTGFPVNARIGVAALEGDLSGTGDTFQIKANSVAIFTPISDILNPADNFFNASITRDGVNVTNRLPDGYNTLGFDIDNFGVPNPGNGTIPNNETGATLRLTTSGDGYGAFVTTFAVDVIEPNILLTKTVADNSGTDVGNGNVTLGQVLNYTIGFQNQGNDNATNFTIKDILPINVVFNPADLTLPAGVTYTYNAATRTIIFTIPDSLVEINDPRLTIGIRVNVVVSCNQLSDACSNIIQNQAFATYRGNLNPAQITDDPSLSSFTSCNLGTPNSTNFLVGVDSCLFARNEILCGESLILTAASGYSSYSWTNSSGTVIGTTQSITVTQPGTYTANNTAAAPCLSIVETVTVTRFGSTLNNPVIPNADEVVICPNDGKELPNIFLCGANDSELIQTNINDAQSIVWERLNEASCPAVTNTDCANENTSCTWTQVGTGPNFNADTAGQYRVVLRYQGGCFNRFYFNVFKNVFNPTVTTRDIFCNTDGEIVVNNVPSGYEYSRDGVNYVPGNVFVINTPGTYTIYIRQINGGANACVFTVPNISINRRVFSASTIVTQPLCNGGRGSVIVQANNVRPQYYFSLFQGATLINSVGPITQSSYTFPNLNPGTYTYNTTTEDGCAGTGTVTIIDPPLLIATAAITKPLTCVSGEITVYPSGGSPPYYYFVNSTTVFQTTPIISTPTAGTYNIRVVDSKNCEYTIAPLTITAIPKPVYTVTKTDVKCYSDRTGEIRFNITNANGYTLAYSIDNGATYVSNPIFSNLAAGTYRTILRYSLSGTNCFDTVQVVVIGQPALALTASAGVSELAGCGPAKEGRIRITNPQGGTGAYQYSFDNQATWTSVNDAYKAPGTYIVYVRDANNCIFSASVTIDPEPPAPIINVDTPVDFNCDGTATSTVVINNPGGSSFSYDYYLDNVLNTNVPSNVFLNVGSGTHVVRVDYRVNTVPTFSNLLSEDFGKGGYTTTPGINPAYCFEDESTLHPVGWPCGNINDYQINDGKYAVASSIKTTFGVWVVAKDHTLPSDPLGRFLCVNVGGAAGIGGVLYSKNINNIIPNQDVRVSIWAENLIKSTSPALGDPNLTIQLWKDYGLPSAVQVGASVNTGSIPKSERWENYNLTINPGNNTNLTFLVRSNSTVINGNDVLIDDINVFQLPKSCTTTKSFTIVVPTGRAFTAQITSVQNVTCFGDNNGQITIAAQNFNAVNGFQYSLNNGATYTTVFSSPVTIPSLPNATYNIIVRPDATSASTCSKPFTQVITTPSVIGASATITRLATCTTGATITATGSGGTPAYQYELRQSDGITVITAFNNNPNFTDVPAGNYTVFVRDSNLCTNPSSFAITVTAPPSLTATLNNTSDYCFTTANPATLVVNVSGGTGPFTYQLDSNASISSALTTFSFANVTPGTHTILVTDSNNCTSTISNIVIAPAVTFNVSLLQDLTCLVDASIGNPLIAGGYGTPYTYTVSYNSGAATVVTSFPYTATLPGTYVFTVSDSRGCPATSNTITVTPKTTPAHTTVKTDITCNGLNNGTITVTASGGFTTTYTYAIKLNSAATFTTQTTNQFTSLAAGTYDIKVIDSKGCESSPTQVTIANPTLIAANATANAFSCTTTNASQSATITVAPTGGTGVYSYSYNNGVTFGSNATLIVNDNGTTQSFQIIVRDANGCLSPMQQIDLAPLNRPTDLTFANAAITCTATTTTVSVTANNGVGALTFIITGTTSATNPSLFVPASTLGSTATFPSLLPGNYTFRVTDANGCYYTESYTVAPVTPIAVTAVKLTDVACFGDNTGLARFTVTGFSAPGNYLINVTSVPASLPFTLSPAGDVRTLTDLVAGTYTFTVTDNTTGCTDSKSITINQPSAGVSITSATASAVFCSNDNSQITITATGGTPNYGYAAVPNGAAVPTSFGTSNVVTVNTTGGTVLVWDVYVRDASGCVTLVPTTVNIINNGTPNVTTLVTNQCSATGSSFQIVASATGGLAPYTYTINTGVAPTGALLDTFTVAPGTYTVTVTDANGCPATTSVTVNQRLTALAAVIKDITCSLPQEASIRVDVSGGSAPFTYRVNIGGAGYSGAPITFAGTSFIYIPASLTGTTYEFEITDANGTPCTAITNVVTTTTPATVTAAEAHVDPTCNGFTDGSITFTSTAGVPPFTYSIDNGVTFVNSNVFGGLIGGTYNYIVRDAKGCDATGTIVLDNPAPIALTVTPNPIQCSPNTPGSIDANVVSGGVPPFTYTILNNAFTPIATSGPIGATTYNFAGLGFGDYYITVIDANGCEVQSISTRILTPPNIQATGLASSGTCLSGASVDIVVVTGAPLFTYQIFGQPSTSVGPTAATTVTFSNLIHGTTYQFQVIDGGGCFTIVEVTTPPSPSTITITPTSSSNVTCNGFNNGTLDFTVQDFDPTVTTINYEVLDALTLSPLSTPINGVLTGAAGGPVSGNITTLPAGNYVLRATEATGTLCSASFPFTITQPIQPLISAVTANVNANCNSGALVTLTTTGGTGPYEYATAVAPAFSTTFTSGNVLTLNPGPAGTDLNWNITVRDARGCTFDLPVTIAVDPSPVIALAIVDKCVVQGTYEIEVTETTAGTGAYSISVDGGTFTSIPGLPYIVSGLNSGSHTIIVRDVNGCTDDETIIIDEPLVTTPAITGLPTCTADIGVITMTGSGGTGTYTYSISPVAGSISGNVISGLPAGTYTITMTDTATPTNCTTTAVVTLSAAIPVTFSTATTPALCVGDSNGSITVTLLAGNTNPTYTYEIIAGPQLAVAQTSNIFTGLLPGTYTVRVNSGRGCSTDDTNVIVAPATPLIASATFTANTTCSTATVITVTPGGGTGSGFTYNFNGLGYTSDNTFTVNNSALATTVNYTVKDANGCETPVQSIITPALNPPTNMDISGSLIYCAPATSTTSTVTITNVQNGVGPFTYQMLTPTSINNGTNNVFSLLTAGDYLFQVTDNNGCTYQELYTVAPRVEIAVEVSSSTNSSCFADNNGTATFTVTNFTSYTATLTSGIGTPVITGGVVTLTSLAPGNYTLQVSDNTTGCTNDVSFTITEPTLALDFTTVATNINCNVDTATITVTPSGGTPIYQYAVALATAPAPPLSAYSLSNVLVVDTNNGVDMNWIVYVSDVNGCRINNPQTILLDSNPSAISVAPYSECPDTLTGTYIFTINPPTGVGPFEYSIGGGFQSNPTFVVNAPGSYDVTVKDINGCQTTAIALVVIRQPLVLTPVVTTPVSCTGGDGQITVSTTGGSGNYVYNIDGGLFVTTTTFTGVAAGTHTLGVRDTTTLCEVFVPVNLQAATLITGFNLLATPVTCNGGTDATITATLATPAPGVNDNPVYTYEITAPIVVAPQTSNLFTGLVAGSYTVVVTSQRGCSATLSIIVPEATLIVVPTPVVVGFGCTSGNIQNNATITVSGVTGGSGTYLNYEFIKGGTTVYLGPNNSYTEANLLGGNYTINVFDDKGCLGTTTATIDPYIALDEINVFVDNAINCINDEDITVSATTIGGTPAILSYTIVDVDAVTGLSGTLYPSQTNNTGIFTGLPVANYLITITNPATGCSIQEPYFVNNPNTFDLTIDSLVNVTCFADSNGSANITLVDTVINGTNPDQSGPFNYTIVNNLGIVFPGGSAPNAGPITISGLPAGTYTFTATLTNTPFCDVTKNFTIQSPIAALSVSETHTEITCVTGNNDGTISASATGGWPGDYQFELVGPVSFPYSTTSDFSGLTAGNYTVNVRDSQNCIAFINVTLVVPTPINAIPVASTSLLTCFGDSDATITITNVTGGQGSNYLYTLNRTLPTPSFINGPQVSPIFTGLGAGTYTITVTDGYNCTFTSSNVVINQPDEIVATLSVATTQTCLTQTTLTLTATGGTSPYSYSVDGTTYVAGTFNPSVTFPVPVGTYQYYIRDANGCESNVSNQIIIDPLPPLSINLTASNINIKCFGDNTGVIDADAQGGLGNYFYTLQDSTGAVILGPQTSGNFPGLFAGSYQVVVDSGDCQTTSSIIQINEPTNPLVIVSTSIVNVTCNGAGNGSIIINASGGTGLIQYSISPNLDQFFNTNTFINLVPAIYQVTVQDQNGCFENISFEIFEPNPISTITIAGSIVQELCAGDNTGAFSIDISGGTTPYSVSLDNLNGPFVTGTITQTQFDFTMLSGGTHIVYIRDGNGCDSRFTVDLNPSVDINPQAAITYNCVDNQANTVVISVDTSVQGQVEYALDGGAYQPNNSFTVNPGPHFVDVRHINGCIKRVNFTVNLYLPIALVLNDGGLNEIVAVATGGSGGYQYELDGVSYGNDNTYIITQSGTYTVRVTDSNGCTTTASRYFEFIDIFIPEVFTPDGDGINDGWTPQNTINYKNLVFYVFDRYGRKLGTFKEGQSWDGKYNSAELPSGDYWYVIKIDGEGDREFVGNFTLYR